MRKHAKNDVTTARRTLSQFMDGAQVTQKKVAAPKPFAIGLRIGRVLAVAYEAGNGEMFEHRFRRSSAPVLIASADGKQLAVIGGRYKFTKRGIIDT